MTFIPPRMPVTIGTAVVRDGRVLFIRGTYGDFQGVWTLPAGFVDEGEEPAAAAIREALEEAGVVCAIDGLISAMTLAWRGEVMLYLVFLARYVSGEPTPDGSETDAAAYLSLDDLAGWDSGAGRLVDGCPVDGQNAFLARRILTGQAQVLLPYEDASWFRDYHATYA